MGKMILITTDNEVKELEYPEEGLRSWKRLKEHIFVLYNRFVHLMKDAKASRKNLYFL